MICSLQQFCPRMWMTLCTFDLTLCPCSFYMAHYKFVNNILGTITIEHLAYHQNAPSMFGSMALMRTTTNVGDFTFLIFVLKPLNLCVLHTHARTNRMLFAFGQWPIAVNASAFAFVLASIFLRERHLCADFQLNLKYYTLAISDYNERIWDRQSAWVAGDRRWRAQWILWKHIASDIALQWKCDEF